ncbi:MAG: IS3 family transposase [Aggregatilineales bacterium]
MQISVSAVGGCYDDAMRESFWGTLKTECADRLFPSRRAAHWATFEYIEIWYNRQRRHSALRAISARPSTSNLLAPDIFSVRQIGVGSFGVRQTGVRSNPGLPAAAVEPPSGRCYNKTRALSDLSAHRTGTT